ncbi:MAG: hypothetical protein R6V04_04340 [bacterium]
MSQEGKTKTYYLLRRIKNRPIKFLEDHTLPDAVGIVEKYLIIQYMTRFSGNQVRSAVWVPLYSKII